MLKKFSPMGLLSLIDHSSNEEAKFWVGVWKFVAKCTKSCHSSDDIKYELGRKCWFSRLGVGLSNTDLDAYVRKRSNQ